MKTAVVDVGGGLRGIYAAAVLDYCLDHDIHFDLGIGISAGSANIASYLAGQRGRNRVYYTDYAFRPEYMSIRNMLTKGCYLDLNYVYGTLSNEDGEYPLDYPRFRDNPCEFIAIATDAVTGKAHYFGKKDIWRDHFDVFKASSAIPVACRPVSIQGRRYFDGALSDTIPIDLAFEKGCDRVVLLLTKPKNIRRRSGHDNDLARLISLRYPKAAENLSERAGRYNAGVYRAMKYAREGKLLIVAPDNTCGVSTLTRDRNALGKLYDKGYHDAEAIGDFIRAGKTDAPAPETADTSRWLADDQPES